MGETGTVVVVEGRSDQAALEALAERQGRDLAAGGVEITAVGGAGNFGRAIEGHVRTRPAVRLAGLCDAREEPYVRRGLERAGLGPVGSRTDLSALGFFVCEADLEEELIRALGPTAVEAIVDVEGETRPYRTFLKQVSQQGRSPEARLHRFLGTHSGRKIRYAGLMVDALDVPRVPRPLAALLAFVTNENAGTSPC